MKRIALIGHRGVGKTSLLTRIQEYYRSANRRVRVFDLDREVENTAGRAISKIFHEDGEAVFRRFETQTLEKIEKEISSSEADVVVALGAGFPVDQLGSSWHAIWIRRPTDETGRIFTDRPRLDIRFSALEEFNQRALARTPKYAARADDVLILDEGDTLDTAERAYFLDEIRDLGCAITLHPSNFSRHFEGWAARRVEWGVRWFELRDDLLTLEQLARAAKAIPTSRLLYSYRKLAPANAGAPPHIAIGATNFDWPVEMGANAPGEPTYLSQHSNGEIAAGVTKLARHIETFAELETSHRWQQEDPLNRVFLPMSTDGRWNWYRQLRNDYALNFIREGDGSASDQPTLLQWIRRQRMTSKNFAAVLGDPVAHSRTPMEQKDFFAKREMSVFAIKVTEHDFDDAIKFLRELGLTQAAVTAPLKLKAQQLVGATEPINTLTFTATSAARGTNTDTIGLSEATKALAQLKTAVWGGGGTLESIAKVFPHATFYSARTGAPRDPQMVATSPELVIWAAGLKHDTPMPPNSWRPKKIFDLNYAEHSPAKAYALQIQADYVSGLAMFKAQAQAQRDFWETS